MTDGPIKILEAHNDTVRSVSFSPNSQHLASSSDDKTILIWDIETGSTINVLTEHSDCVNSIAFSPNGRHLVSGPMTRLSVFGIYRQANQSHFLKGTLIEYFLSPSRAMASGSSQALLIAAFVCGRQIAVA